MKLTHLVTLLSITLACFQASALPSVDKLTQEMDKVGAQLRTYDGWKKFIKENPTLFKEVSNSKPSFVGVGDFKVSVDGNDYKIGLGCRSVFIAAQPKVVVGIINNPKFFQSLYGLDDTAFLGSPKDDGSFDAKIYKLVPGIETQNYTLHYSGAWQKDVWIGQAKQTKDEKNFAIRDNLKLVEAAGTGSVYREVALFFPMRWWMGMISGIVHTVTKKELGKINFQLKCAAEKVQSGVAMNEDVGKTCYKESLKSR